MFDIQAKYRVLFWYSLREAALVIVIITTVPHKPPVWNILHIRGSNVSRNWLSICDFLKHHILYIIINWRVLISNAFIFGVVRLQDSYKQLLCPWNRKLSYFLPHASVNSHSSRKILQILVACIWFPFPCT